MTTHKEALTLALEALEKHGDAYLGHSTEYYSAIQAAKEALAQPEQPKVRTGDCLLVGVCASEGHKIQKAQLEQEPVAKCAQCKKEYRHGKTGVGCPKCAPNVNIPESEFQKPITPPQPKEPEQEPYGLLNIATGVVRKSWEGTGYVGALVEVYTTPPQRKPLTDEEINARAKTEGANNADFWAGVRFSEAEHCIKE